MEKKMKLREMILLVPRKKANAAASGEGLPLLLLLLLLLLLCRFSRVRLCAAP